MTTKNVQGPEFDLLLPPMGAEFYVYIHVLQYEHTMYVFANILHRFSLMKYKNQSSQVVNASIRGEPGATKLQKKRSSFQILLYVSFHLTVHLYYNVFCNKLKKKVFPWILWASLTQTKMEF